VSSATAFAGQSSGSRLSEGEWQVSDVNLVLAGSAKKSYQRRKRVVAAIHNQRSRSMYPFKPAAFSNIGAGKMKLKRFLTNQLLQN